MWNPLCWLLGAVLFASNAVADGLVTGSVVDSESDASMLHPASSQGAAGGLDPNYRVGIRPLLFDPWLEHAKLAAADGAAADDFASQVALSDDGDTALVGAEYADVDGNDDQGAVYVLTRGDGGWTEQAKLVASAGAMGDRFGSTLAISGDGGTAMIAAPGPSPPEPGQLASVYVFTRSEDVWTHQATLTDADAGANVSGLGRPALTDDGDMAVLGGSLEGGEGAVFVFTRDGGVWSREATLTASDGSPADNFGSAIAIAETAGDTILVGALFAWFNGPPPAPLAGAAYVFAHDGGAWSQQAKLFAATPQILGTFGRSVALSADGDTALVGAESHDHASGGQGQGAAYAFTRSEGTWSAQAMLTASDAAELDAFGWSVALSADGDTALIGARKNVDGEGGDRGAAYVSTREDGVWSESAKLTASDGTVGDAFGSAVALADAGDRALIGAPHLDVDGRADQGAAYAFDRFVVPPDFGTIEGTVKSRGRCRTAVVPLQGATIELVGAQETYVVTTRYDGYFRTFLPDIESPLDITAAAAGHLPATLENLEFGGGDVMTVDIHLILEEPCATADPANLLVELDPGDSTSTILSIGNLAGGAELSWEITSTTDQGTCTEPTPVPWLGLDPLSGSTPAGEFSDVHATLDAAVLAPGEYHADICVSSDDPAQPWILVPVTLSVVPPDGYAIVQGTVEGLGYCRTDHGPIPDVQVTIESSVQSYTVAPDENGFFRQAWNVADGSVVDISVSAPGHLPQANPDVVLLVGDTVTRDFGLTLEEPCADVEPEALALELPEGVDIQLDLTIGNTDGGAALDWAIETAAPPTVTAPVGASLGDGGGLDCDTEPGLIVHDDGGVDIGYFGLPGIALVDRFTPNGYPASFHAVCLAWFVDGTPPPSQDFEVIVYDDDGPGGGPGAELGTLAATATDIPSWPVDTPVWVRVDISALGIVIESGSVYIGARWTPETFPLPPVALGVDETPDRPVGFAGGYLRNSDSLPWTPIQEDPSFGEYRSLFVRALHTAAGCDDPSTIPWLSLSPSTGSTPGGGSAAVALHVDSTGLVAGEYTSNLCITTSDAVRSLIVVPVTLSVTPVGGVALVFEPSSLDFGDVEGGSTSPPSTATLENLGDTDATELFLDSTDAAFEVDDTDCGATLPTGASCTVTVSFTPSRPGSAVASLRAHPSNGTLAALGLSGNGIGGGGFTAVALEVDRDVLASDANGVFEPDELVEAAPIWRNDSPFEASLTGTASNFGGTVGATYVLALANADYGSLAPGAMSDCLDMGVCYFLAVNDLAGRPATHWEAAFDETLSDDTVKTWGLHIGDSFTDVPRLSPFYEAIETLLHHGVTGGCTGSEYCASGTNTRGQMAVFLLKAAEGGDYVPPACVVSEQLFADVPFDSPLCPWIEELAARQVTTGCGSNNYCPGDPVSRAQMAIFLLKAFEGGGYTPPECTGEFTDVTCSSSFAAWIEELAARGVTGGCAGDPPAYCPTTPVTRAQMAVFVTKTFGLTLYGP